MTRLYIFSLVLIMSGCSSLNEEEATKLSAFCEADIHLTLASENVDKQYADLTDAEYMGSLDIEASLIRRDAEKILGMPFDEIFVLAYENDWLDRCPLYPGEIR